MIVQHKKTGREYALTPEAWKAIQAKGQAECYQVISAPEPPKEVLKNARPPKSEKSGDDHNGVQANDDRLSKQDAGEVE